MTAKEKVLKVYPNAVYKTEHLNGQLRTRQIFNGNEPLGSKQSQITWAWASAVRFLKKRCDL